MGIEHLRQYRRAWDEDRKMFGPDPAKTPHNHTPTPSATPRSPCATATQCAEAQGASRASSMK
jgi:hypothetical protein